MPRGLEGRQGGGAPPLLTIHGPIAVPSCRRCFGGRTRGGDTKSMTSGPSRPRFVFGCCLGLPCTLASTTLPCALAPTIPAACDRVPPALLILLVCTSAPFAPLCALGCCLGLPCALAPTTLPCALAPTTPAATSAPLELPCVTTPAACDLAFGCCLRLPCALAIPNL